MKHNILTVACLLTFAAGCGSQTSSRPIEGEVVSNLDSQTFHAEYKGQNLKVGDRVRILKYEDFESELKDHQSRTLPLNKKKVLIGEGVISSVLKDDYYEFKSKTPQHIPEGAFIEKI